MIAFQPGDLVVVVHMYPAGWGSGPLDGDVVAYHSYTQARYWLEHGGAG